MVMLSSSGMTNSLLSSERASAYPFGVTATVTSAPDKELLQRERGRAALYILARMGKQFLFK